MKGIVISSGYISDYKRLEDMIKESDFIICADGGTNHVINIDYRPNLIIGDLDSIYKETLKIIKDENIEILKYPSNKGKTDTELALEYLIEKNFDDITLMGVTGNRQDHTQGNIYLLNRLLDKGINGKIVDDNNIIYLVKDYLEIQDTKNTFVSIIPITEKGIIITLKGFLYPLQEEKIEFSSTLGISNKIIEDIAKIKIHKGKALVFVSKD